MIRPNYWSTELDWEANISNLDVIWDEANSAVCMAHGQTQPQTIVDELAILVPNRDMAMWFVEQAVSREALYFNNSADAVHTEPMGTDYRVQYHFLRMAGKPYRLEIMHLIDGYSPLHRALFPQERAFPVVHASWKPAWGQQPEDYYTEQECLKAAGYVMAQACGSHYGQFSYWRNPASPVAMYLKPRINARDQEVAARTLTKGNYEIDANDPEDVPRRKGTLRTPAEVLDADEEFRA